MCTRPVGDEGHRGPVSVVIRPLSVHLGSIVDDSGHASGALRAPVWWFSAGSGLGFAQNVRVGRGSTPVRQ